ncbi:MAG: maltotransferase domain-containing protein, partial [Candidatus Acidiferrales bacterium]
MPDRPVDQQIESRRRVVIEGVTPEIDCGRFPIKRVVGDMVRVEAAVFADGHDQVTCRLLYWQDPKNLLASPMMPLTNDRWRGEFFVAKLGRYQYTIEGWIDHFQTWRAALMKRVAAQQNLNVELLIGADLIEEAATQAPAKNAEILCQWAKRLREAKDKPEGASIALEEELLGVLQQYPVRNFSTRYEKDLSVTVDRDKARFSTWYEVFPRSCSPQPGRHGTFRDCEQVLPYIASMGFDVVYLPPVHPIGRSFRKGKNNSTAPQPTDVGSPWAIGSTEGGHKSILPQLGTLEDFKHFRSAAEKQGLEVALDIAFQ